MKRLLGLFLLLLLPSFALELTDTVTLNMPEFGLSQETTTSVKELSLENLEPIETKAFVTELDDRYAPGEVITINVRVAATTPKITAVSAFCFGQKVSLGEFEDKVWTGAYRLPKDIEQGRYFFKVYLTGPEQTLYEPATFNIVYRLADIVITGNRSVSIAALAEIMNIKPGEFYSPIKTEVTRQKFLDFGLFEKVSALTAVSGNQLVLKYYLKENPEIKKIDIIGSIEFSKEELLNQLVLKPGDTLSNRQLQKDMVALEGFYKSKDYIFFRILSVERPSSANNYSLVYRIDESKVRSIEIEGNTVTQRYVIAREMELKKGSIFNAGTLREDLRRVYNLNYFSNVVPDLKFDEDTGEVDVKVKVEEKKTSSVNFGGGYGQLQGWFGFTDLFLDNIMGTAQSTLFKAQFGQRLTSYQFKYHNPWMWDNKTSFTAKLWSTYGFNYLSGDRELRNGWSGTVGFQRSLYVREDYTYRYEDVFNYADRSQDYLDRAVAYAWSYDSRDQWMNPTTGFYNVYSMDHSSKLLGGTINTSRYSLQFNQFYPIAEKQVFAFREMYNYQLGDVFASEQYYVGSDSTVRGYRYIFAKGNERALMNVEYRYIFSDMFVGVLFYDIGQATQPVFDPNDEDNNFSNHHGWASGMGFGMRIITPMGPIRLDYGWPQYKEFADGFLSFNMGQVF